MPNTVADSQIAKAQQVIDSKQGDARTYIKNVAAALASLRNKKPTLARQMEIEAFRNLSRSQTEEQIGVMLEIRDMAKEVPGAPVTNANNRARAAAEISLAGQNSRPGTDQVTMIIAEQTRDKFGTNHITGGNPASNVESFAPNSVGAAVMAQVNQLMEGVRYVKDSKTSIVVGGRLVKDGRVISAGKLGTQVKDIVANYPLNEQQKSKVVRAIEQQHYGLRLAENNELRGKTYTPSFSPNTTLAGLIEDSKTVRYTYEAAEIGSMVSEVAGVIKDAMAALGKQVTSSTSFKVGPDVEATIVDAVETVLGKKLAKNDLGMLIDAEKLTQSVLKEVQAKLPQQHQFKGVIQELVEGAVDWVSLGATGPAAIPEIIRRVVGAQWTPKAMDIAQFAMENPGQITKALAEDVHAAFKLLGKPLPDWTYYAIKKVNPHYAATLVKGEDYLNPLDYEDGRRQVFSIDLQDSAAIQRVADLFSLTDKEFEALDFAVAERSLVDAFYTGTLAGAPDMQSVDGQNLLQATIGLNVLKYKENPELLKATPNTSVRTPEEAAKHKAAIDRLTKAVADINAKNPQASQTSKITAAEHKAAIGRLTKAVAEINGGKAQASQSSPTFQAPDAAAVAAVQSGAKIIHDIKRGDTLSQISQAYGVSIGKIAADNGIADVNQIKAGDKRKRPVLAAFYPTPLSVTLPDDCGLLSVRLN